MPFSHTPRKSFIALLFSHKVHASLLHFNKSSNHVTQEEPLKFLISLFLSMNLAISSFFSASAVSAADRAIRPEESTADAALNVSAPSVLLMEASTGAVIYEKNSHEILHPASITKIMTLILIFDALASRQISLTDTVTVSEHAASMGGSQVFLEPGEIQSVDTMIKCISVASANDACVAFMYSRHYSAYGF